LTTVFLTTIFQLLVLYSVECDEMIMYG